MEAPTADLEKFYKTLKNMKKMDDKTFYTLEKVNSKIFACINKPGFRNLEELFVKLSNIRHWQGSKLVSTVGNNHAPSIFCLYLFNGVFYTLGFVKEQTTCAIRSCPYKLSPFISYG